MSYIRRILGVNNGAHKKRHPDYKYEVENSLKIAYIYAKKEVVVKDNTNVFVDVKAVRIHKNNLVIMCPYLRHKLGGVVGVGEDIFLPITSEREIEKVLFCVASDGVIKKDDLLGAVLFIPVNEV